MKKILSLSLLMLSIAALTAAQTKKASLLYKLAAAAAANNGGFNKKSLFTETDTIASLNSKATSVLSIFAGLKLNTSAALEIAESKPNSLQVQIPFKAYKNFTLSLAKQKLNNNNNFSFGTLKGNHIKTKVGGENGVHYRGYIEGDSTSFASISFFKDGSVMALFSNSTGNFIVGKMGNQKGNYIIYNDRNMRIPQNIQCATSEKEIMGKPLTNTFPLPSTGETAPATLCKKVMLYWEGDYELYNYNFSANLSATQNYMEGLFNQFAAMYQNEGIIVEAAEMNVWTSNDPYRNSPSINGLNDFKAYWNAAGNTFNGNMAHLIAGGKTNNGGIAYILGFFCSDKSYSYAYSNIWGFYNSVPTWSWDVEVVTHETGHNFGSQHTQWCGWNTGPGGTCGAIDNCYTLENGGGCSTCPATTDTAHLPVGWQGTVMSYCHLSYIGINLANGFGPLPQSVIRNAVSSGTCLNSLISVTATPQPICSANDGAVVLTYNANNLGTSPYTYLWTPGNYTTKNITGLNTAGTYQVNITDQAGCKTSLSANVKALSKPGKLEKLTIAMPVCCKESPDSIELRTKSLNLLSDCETIAWLRSATPLKTYADVQQAYNDAIPSNLFFSNSINSNVAVLKVKPPVSCDADSTWYYAAYVSKKKVAQKNITGNSTYQGSVVGSGGTAIGSYVNIADQNSQAPPCQSSPTIKLTVDVTEYTGRQDKMTIAIEDKNFSLITAVYNQAGVGSYDINTFSLANIPLNEINVLVYDYNCSGSSCTASSTTFTAKRVVTYAGTQKPTFEEACSVAAADTITFSPNASVCKTLAAVFTGFNVAPDNCSVNINWQTVNETPGSSFIIEKSADGRSFATLSNVPSQNKALNNYLFKDNNPASGKNYYRIIEKDANGKSFSTLTKMIEINCLGNNVIKLYPNPANSAIFLRSTLGIKQIQIVNNTGQTIINKSNAQVANGIFKLDVKQLSGGIYICKVLLEDGTVQNIKFIKN